MFATNTPKVYWGEAVLTATYLINRMSSRVLSFKTPKEVLLSSYPDTKLMSILPFKLFGCVVYVYIQGSMRTKLDRKTRKCIFWDILVVKRDINVIVPLLEKCLFP